MPSGTITEWNPERGFGYIDSDGHRLFLHFRDFTKRYKAPEVGDKIIFEIGKDKKGRPCAQKAVHVNEGGRITSENILFLCLLMGAPTFALVRLALTINGAYLASYVLFVSTVTYFIYAWDKRRATQKQYRESEFVLHQLAVLGGWPGGFIAQRRLRHKCSKVSFQVVFWTIVALHQFVALDYLNHWKASHRIAHEAKQIIG